jgi:hypothetical protein
MAVTMIIRRIAPLSCAKIAGIVYAALGLLFGVIVALFSSLGATFAAAQTRVASPLLGLFMGVGAIIVLPIFYGIIGFLSALITAWVYNLVASRVGGIEIDVA